MEEKNIVQSKSYNIKMIAIVLFVAVFILIIGGFWVDLSSSTKAYYAGGYYDDAFISSKIWHDFKRDSGVIIPVALIPSIGFAVLFFMLYNKVELTVTNKRIFGKSSFGKRVDIPVDSISAVGTGLFSSIAVTSSSGAIKFGMIKNLEEVHKAISDLIIARQEKTVSTTTIKQEIPQSNADELKKFKELLDSGIISQEEFDAKKKQLLGL